MDCEAGLTVFEGDGGTPGVLGLNGVGAGEVLEVIGGAVGIGIPVAGWVGGRIIESELGPRGEINAIGQGQDPLLKEFGAGGIGDIGADGRHLAWAA